MRWKHSKLSFTYTKSKDFFFVQHLLLAERIIKFMFDNKNNLVEMKSS